MAALRACGFIVFRRLEQNIQFLLLQTSYGDHHWTPPKGHVDPGENDLDTAFRETEEEAGLKPDRLQVVEGFCHELRYTVRDRPKTTVYWLAELSIPEPKVTLSHEHQDSCWVEVDKACSLVRYPDMQGALRGAKAFLDAATH
uniref:Bis(5'-nucleosyl)-tetraphosphatase [asymmetrical] n=1 Tax=Eptatretus burgeri TaxID=7764 RepID=A0A8C4WZM3_EPTBU